MKTPSLTTVRLVACSAAVGSFFLRPLPAQQAPTPPVTQRGEEAKGDAPVSLSPFTVSSTKDSGYFAENTLAGSRLNTNLADMAASISVVTKQQLEDTGSVDINDIFRFEASTEGSKSYTPSILDRGTAKDSVAGYTYGADGTTTTNAQSNRIRGLSAPDAAINNFSTNNRIPFDAYNTQSIEISRGPNSLLFGLGTPSGVVNQNAAQAILNRNTATAQVRTDHNGSLRTSLAINRSLIQDRLAVFGAFLYDNRQFERKPSRDLYRRWYGAATYRPFQKTVIRGFAERYVNDANRPNSLSPRDFVTPWLEAGRPAYDPIARTITVLDTNRVLGPYVSSNQSPGYNAAVNTVIGTGALTAPAPGVAANPLYTPGIGFLDTGRPLRRIDNGKIVDFFARQPQLYALAQTSPAQPVPTGATLGWVAQDPRYLFLDRYWTASVARVNPTLSADGKTYTYGSYQNPGVTNKSIYDWTKYNHLQTNFDQTKAKNLNLELEQQILPNLFFSAGWLRQDIDEASNLTMNSLTGATLRVDTNTKMINGTPNPYFGIPFVSEGEGGGLDTFFLPEVDDNYRAMLAYEMDFKKNNGWTRFLGRHRLLGLFQEQDVLKRTERWRMNFVAGSDPDTTLRYTSNLALAGQNQALSTATMRSYYMGSPGGPQAKVTHSAGWYQNMGWQAPFTSEVEVWNYQNSQFEKHSITEKILYSNAGSGQGSTQREVVGRQLALQSYFWDDRLVTTFGWRRDNYRARVTTTGAITDVTGKVVEPAIGNDRFYLNGVTGLQNRDLALNRWNRWDKLSGNTKTLGAAFRPLKGAAVVKKMGEGPAAEFLDGLTLYYNESDNFNPPATFQTDYFTRPLPKPTGSGRDVGIGFNVLNNKLVARVNWYETESQNERTGSAQVLLTRLAYSDTTTGLAWASTVQRLRNGIAAGRTLQQIIAVNNWNTETVNPVGDEANQRKIYDLIHLPYQYYNGLSSGATQQSKAEGVELQLTYNPTPGWTMKFTGSKNKATYTDIAPQYDAWLAQRLPVWQSNEAPDIPDFVDPNNSRRYSLKKFWPGYGYSDNALIENTNGNTSSEAYFNNQVVTQVALAKALEGSVAPLQRLYHASFLTNYQFREGRFKGFGVGGSQRWESKAALGYFGKVGDPVNNPTVISVSDVTRPVYDNGTYTTDLWVSYTRKIFRDRIGLKLQLNINDAFESGRLMPTQVNFDGTPWSYRIIDPREFILTATFTY